MFFSNDKGVEYNTEGERSLNVLKKPTIIGTKYIFTYFIYSVIVRNLQRFTPSNFRHPQPLGEIQRQKNPN